MQLHGRILSAALVLGLAASPALADQKHAHKQEAKHAKHAVQRSNLFREMDTNRDGVISRREWRGNGESFRRHDWNHNGVLSGGELERGVADPVAHATPRATAPRTTAPHATAPRTERDEVLFARRDVNRDGRITRDEWHDSVSRFNSLDKNHDGVLSPYEYGVGR
jgi:Ca2+-binding EF-hand superfamily protein